MRDLGIIENGAVLIDGESITAVGKVGTVERQVSGSVETIDAHGMVVMPGFVDPHTHLVYGGSREEEFALRLDGVDYAEISRRGGGIKSTVRATRETAEEELFATGYERLNRLLMHGTTTVEAKSGYGLNQETELKQLRVIQKLNDSHSVDVVSTFLGAHAIPEESSSTDYTRLVVKHMLPEVAKLALAEFCDVFCEQGFFSYEESKEILGEAKRLGFKLKIHADELSASGGSELAGELGAVSADHLVYPSKTGLKSMSEAGVVAVLLPGTIFMLGLKDRPPTDEFIRVGIPVALASDLNPGTCTIESMQIIVGLASLILGMSPEEALAASTINAAYAIGRGDQIGSLEPGKIADILVFNVPNYKYLVYHFTTNHLRHVVKKGKLIFSK
jgi:imidazolonepropionase